MECSGWPLTGLSLAERFHGEGSLAHPPGDAPNAPIRGGPQEPLRHQLGDADPGSENQVKTERPMRLSLAPCAAMAPSRRRRQRTVVFGRFGHEDLRSILADAVSTPRWQRGDERDGAAGDRGADL